MKNAAGPLAFWCAAAGLGAAYVGLFLAARRPVSLRLSRLGGMAAVVILTRATLHAAGWPLEFGREGIPGVVFLLAVAGGWLAGRVWLLRSPADEFRQQLETACRGLFLKLEEARPGQVSLTASGRTASLGLRQLTANLQVLVLPQPGGMGKVALLVQWLSKQYPGPVPKVRIVLTRSEP